MGKKTLEGGANMMTFGGYSAAKKATGLGDGVFGKSGKVKGFDRDTNSDVFVKDRFKEAIMGKGNSLAEKQMNAGFDQTNKQALAFAGSARGASNPALAFRQAQQIQGEQQAQINQQAAELRAQEQQQALGGLANYMTNQNQQALEQNKANATTNENRRNQLWNSLSNLGSAAVAKSDENAKENIKEEKKATDKITEFMNALKAYNYDYKDEKNGQGKQMGVMAQDLEKTQVGSQMVEDTENGKMVDFGKGFGATLAAIADLNKRLKKMEGKGE